MLQIFPTLHMGLRGGYYRPSDQGREAKLAEAWRQRGQSADSPADWCGGAVHRVVRS